MSAALELIGIRKRYGAVTALHETSLAVDDGRLVFLLGPSGCGKTTTLRIIAGYVEPDAGEVRLGGEDVTGTPPERRGLGMVFQHYALFPHMTVFDNVAFGLRMRRLGASAIRDRVGRALDLVRLGGLGARYPRALSGGQQQRVALARAVVIEPRLLLLDEPLSNLDLKLREEMRSEIRALQRALGITTLFVTHDQEEALTMADEIVVMADGKVVQRGTPTDLYARPATRFVARFIGESNVESVRVTARVHSDTWRVEATDLSLVGTGEERWTPGAAVAVVIRPERIHLGPAGGRSSSDAENRLAGTVEECVFRGPLRRYRIRLGPDRVWSVDEPITGDAPAHPVGAQVELVWSVRDCRLVADV